MVQGMREMGWIKRENKPAQEARFKISGQITDQAKSTQAGHNEGMKNQQIVNQRQSEKTTQKKSDKNAVIIIVAKIKADALRIIYKMRVHERKSRVQERFAAMPESPVKKHIVFRWADQACRKKSQRGPEKKQCGCAIKKDGPKVLF